MITTSIQDATSPHAEAILATASGPDIAYYRGGEYFRYDHGGDFWRQIQELKPRVAGLAAGRPLAHRLLPSRRGHDRRGPVAFAPWRVDFNGPVNLHYEHSNLLGTNLGTWTLPISREQFATVQKDLLYLRAQLAAAAKA